jgi:hypothetical protein
MAMAAATCAEQDVVAARSSTPRPSTVARTPDWEEIENGGIIGGGRPGRSWSTAPAREEWGLNWEMSLRQSASSRRRSFSFNLSQCTPTLSLNRT